MKIAFLSVFAFACTSFAVPVPATTSTQIQKLEVTILDVIRDLSQGKACLKKDYAAGLDQYEQLVDELAGSENCTPLVSFQPKSEDHAIDALNNSLRHLLQSNPTPRTDLKKRDLSQLTLISSQPSICSAFARYYAVKPYVQSL